MRRTRAKLLRKMARARYNEIPEHARNSARFDLFRRMYQAAKRAWQNRDRT